MIGAVETRPAPLPVAVQTGRERAVRMLDFIIALLMLVAMIPVLIIAVIAIRVSSPGPAIFRQRRLGRDGTAFTVLKFRTMRADADQKRHRDYVHELIRSADARSDAREELYKLVVDDRITSIGRLLRKTSLDELPQLWNVIRGEMSLVGPRPVIPYEAQIYPNWYLERFGVRPGLTGLWQVSGRNQRTYEEMVELDIEYVRRYSLGLYLRILLQTVPAVLLRKGAA
jgi:lipopolysaccharide/colanic/teichoic acid biosynthesis glycosyltransferase